MGLWLFGTKQGLHKILQILKHIQTATSIGNIYDATDVFIDDAGTLDDICHEAASINFTFDYNNLLVSCQGNHFNEIGDNSKSTCGHIKDNNFDEVKFLNPTLVTDISDYFVFDSDTGIISASKKDKIKAEYTIQILNLNGKNDKLAHARKIAKDALIRNFNKLPIEERKLRLKAFLQNESNEFISFFRYLYNGFS